MHENTPTFKNVLQLKHRIISNKKYSQCRMARSVLYYLINIMDACNAVKDRYFGIVGPVRCIPSEL